MNYSTVELREDENGDLILPIPDEIIEQLGWEIDDLLEFQLDGDGCRIINLSK